MHLRTFIEGLAVREESSTRGSGYSEPWREDMQRTWLTEATFDGYYKRLFEPVFAGFGGGDLATASVLNFAMQQLSMRSAGAERGQVYVQVGGDECMFAAAMLRSSAGTGWWVTHGDDPDPAFSARFGAAFGASEWGERARARCRIWSEGVDALLDRERLYVGVLALVDLAQADAGAAIIERAWSSLAEHVDIVVVGESESVTATLSRVRHGSSGAAVVLRGHPTRQRYAIGYGQRQAFDYAALAGGPVYAA